MIYRPEMVEGIATIIGVDQYNVEKFLRLSRTQQLLYHGVKNATFLPGIETRGVMPLTPESRGSHWTTGTRTFSNRKDRIEWGSFDTYDTPFFCYSNGGLVITDHATLLEHKIPVEWRDDDEITIHTPVPREAITIIRMDNYKLTDSRNRDFPRDRLLFDILLSHLSNYMRGRTIPLVNSIA